MSTSLFIYPAFLFVHCNRLRQRSNCSTVHSFLYVWGPFLQVHSQLGIVNSLKFDSFIVHLRVFFVVVFFCFVFFKASHLSNQDLFHS